MTKLSALLAVLLLGIPRLLCQAEPAAYGPGSYVQAGAAFSAYQTAYGQRKLGGVTAFVDAHVYRRIGAEAEIRRLDLHEDEGAHSATYLVGPRFSVLAGRFRPYAKLLAGRGAFTFPYGYAHGSYSVVAPGGGVDWHVGRGRLTVRIIDVELQYWPGFSFGPIRPYGINTGLAFRVF